MAAPSLRSAVFEVERKFARLRIYPLHTSGGSSPFKSLAHLGSSTFRDIYYDTDSLLSRAGTWVRQRDGNWESKIRQAGDYNQSQFKEIKDHELIREQVASLTADITTKRESWLADGRFKIVLDQTDFGHTVGEVELGLSMDTDNTRETNEVCAKMDQDIVLFIHKYSWAFDNSRAISKLTAYFAQNASMRTRQ